MRIRERNEGTGGEAQAGPISNVKRRLTHNPVQQETNPWVELPSAQGNGLQIGAIQGTQSLPELGRESFRLGNPRLWDKSVAPGQVPAPSLKGKKRGTRRLRGICDLGSPSPTGLRETPSES